MSPSEDTSASLWDDTAFLEKCVSGNGQNRLAHEKLGLFVTSRRPDKSAQFGKDFADKLYSRVIEIAHEIRKQYGKRFDERKAALLNKATLNDECAKLEEEFGQDIRDYQRISKRNLGYILDSETVQFYLHCWIAICVRQSATKNLSKKIIEELANSTEHVEVNVASPREENNDQTSSFRAPEARMVSTQSRGEHPERMETLPEQEGDEHFFDQFLDPAEPSVTHESSSRKRKAVHGSRNGSNSKLPKILRASESTALDRARGNDVYSLENVPRRTRSLSTIGRATPGDARLANTHRGNVNGDDAETDREDAAETEPDNQVELSDEREPTIRRSVGPFEGPSNPTPINIDRARATIPDGELETTVVTIEDEQQGQQHTNQTNSSTHAQRLRTTEIIAGDIKQSRKELSELLLEYLLSKGRFRPDNFDVKDEAVMDQLLRSLSEIEKSRCRGGDLERFTELHSALETWISIRKSLGTFRQVVKYYGQPGEHGIDWANYLDQMNPTARIESVWAFVELKGSLTQQQRELLHWDRKFHDDLVDMFDMLIRRKMFGKATFEFVKVFNQGLLQWFSEDECSE